jgi:crotonobetainyl-CoA:carnitine CoA-transferase CaiB-like acyl-CoA transferase
MARTTKAAYAVIRLKERSNSAPYSMVSTADGRFYLVLHGADGALDKLCEPMEIDDFVRFVNGINKAAPKKASKLDVAFEAKLRQAGKGQASGEAD